MFHVNRAVLIGDPIMWGELRASPTVLNVDFVGPGFHVKHVDIE